MKTKLIQTVAFFVVCAALAAQAAPLEYENLVVAVPADWDTITNGRDGDLSMVEMVPKGETGDEWTRMITIQTFHNLGGTSPKLFVEKLSEAVKKQLDGPMHTKPLDFANDSEYPTAGVLWFLGKVKSSGKGEITLIRAIQGQDALYVVQKAWRQPAFTSVDQVTLPKEEIQGGIVFLQQVKVVDGRKQDTSGIRVDKEIYHPPTE